MPDVEVLKHWAFENDVPGTLTVLCNNPEVKHLILNDMISLGKEFGLKSFEQVSQIFIYLRLGRLRGWLILHIILHFILHFIVM